MLFVLNIRIFDMIWPFHIENLHKVDIYWPKKYELKISFPSPIIDFDEWYGEKNAEVKGTPPRKYKAKSKTLIVKMLEDVLSGKGISGYQEVIKDFNDNKDKSDLITTLKTQIQ